MKRKIKIAKNVAKVPERRTKMRRKKREKRSSGRWFCRREIFNFGWGVCVVHVAIRFGSGFGKIVKCQTDLQKKCQMELHNDMEKNENHVSGKRFWEGSFLGSRINRAFSLPKNDFWENVLTGILGKILEKFFSGNWKSVFGETFGRTERTVEDDKKEF